MTCRNYSPHPGEASRMDAAMHGPLATLLSCQEDFQLGGFIKDPWGTNIEMTEGLADVK